MKRIGLFLLAVVMVGLAGCGGGDNDYNFAGQWIVSSTVKSSNCNVTAWSGTLTIAQSGNSISLTHISGTTSRTYTGTCDPGAGTFTAEGDSGDTHFKWIGAAVDDENMAGTRTATRGSCTTEITWTAMLASR